MLLVCDVPGMSAVKALPVVVVVDISFFYLMAPPLLVPLLLTASVL